MKRIEFERVLDESLNRLQSGAGIEEILTKYPQHATRLEPLLQAAKSAWSLPEPDPLRSRREGRNRLLAEVDQMESNGEFTKNGTKSPFSRYSRQWINTIRDLVVGKEKTDMKLLPKLALYGMMTVLIAGFFTVNASASSLPGDPLYGLKLGWEEIRLALTFDDDSRLELKWEFEDERLEEVEDLLEEGRVEDVEFYGLIESMGEENWVVSGITVDVDMQTEIHGVLEIGDLVKVEALTLEDGSLLALEIYPDGYEDLEEGDSDDDLDDDSDDEMDSDSDDDDSDSDDDDESESDDDDSESEEDEEDEEDSSEDES